MTARKFGLAVVCTVSAAVVLSGAHAQIRPSPGGSGPQVPQQQPQQAPQQPPAQSDRFVFQVCNRSKIPLFAAVLYRRDATTWHLFGWTPYKPGQCGPVRGDFPRDDFFWYVEDGPSTVTYPGNDAQGCINPKANFDRTFSGEYQCAPGERIVGFTKIDEKGIREGITLTD